MTDRRIDTKSHLPKTCMKKLLKLPHIIFVILVRLLMYVHVHVITLIMLIPWVNVVWPHNPTFPCDMIVSTFYTQ